MGKLLKIDINTVQQERGRYARTCVEIDLKKPLKTYIRFKKKVCRFEYEALNMICFSCGRFGHNKEGCKYKNSAEVNVNEQESSETAPEPAVPPPPNRNLSTLALGCKCQ